MKFAYLGASVVAALAVAAPASAEIHGAVNAGVQAVKFETVNVDDAKLATVGGRVGWKANRWIGVEGDLFFGLKDDRVLDAPPVDVKIDSAAFSPPARRST